MYSKVEVFLAVVNLTAENFLAARYPAPLAYSFLPVAY
jgi:hypothetical protein